MKIVNIIFILLSLIVASCEDNSIKSENVLCGDWEITDYLNISNPRYCLSRSDSQNQLSMEFRRDGNVFCTTDCNLISARYIINGREITFSEISYTEKACDDMRMEGIIKDILPSITSFDIAGDYLTLKDSKDQVVLKLVKS